MDPKPEQVGFCSRCHEHAVATFDPDMGEVVTECCAAPLTPDDVEED